MYERSAIVLERYFNNILGGKKADFKKVVEDYRELVEKTRNYQEIIENEDKIIEEFDKAANNITTIQQEQKKIYKSNMKLEEERNQLFDNLDDTPEAIEKKLKKIETSLIANNAKIEELREAFINSLTTFSQKQSERNKYSRTRRTEEKAHLQVLEKSNNDLENIGNDLIASIKEFINSENEESKKEIIQIMINNGKGERIPFYPDVIEKAVSVKYDITRKKAECYITAYDKTRRLLSEINNDEIKLSKYEKNLKDISVKLAYLEAENNYIVSFLDNERMTTINGKKIHERLMAEACENFESDIEQFNNLYQLVLKEVSGKSTKKAYKELYNKEYLKNIEEKEKNFEKEINNIKIKAGAIINSNYWRIEEIKNIYQVFQNEISEKFEKDLSEFQLEEPEEILEIEEEIPEENDDIFKKYIQDDDDEEYEDDDEYYDDEEDEYSDDDEYEDDDEEYDDDDEEYEDDDEEYYDDDDEYEDDDDEYYDDDDEYEDDDEEYDDDDEEYEEDDEDEENAEEDDDNDDHIEEEDKKQNKGIFKKFFKDKK